MGTCFRRLSVGVLITCSPSAWAQNCNPVWYRVGDERGVITTMAEYADAGGNFLYVGGTSMSRPGAGSHTVARWNGNAWSPSPGIPGTGFVCSLQVLSFGGNSSLYAGTTSALYRWNGSNFGSLTTATNGATAMTVFQDAQGEAFFTVNLSGRLYRWAGQGAPVDLGRVAPANIFPNSFAVFNDGTGAALYLGAFFDRIITTSGAEVSAAAVARWNGIQWSPVGMGMTGSTSWPGRAGVECLTVWDDGSGPALYAAGAFEFADNQPVSSLARWRGQGWEPVGNAIARQREVSTIRVLDQGDGPALYIAGDFESYADCGAMSLAKWDGSNWSSVESAFTGPIRPVMALATFSDPFGIETLYLGGDFVNIAGAPLRGLARLVCNCPDLDHDGNVGLSDITTLLANYGSSNVPPNSGDLDDSGAVEIHDLTLLLAQFGVNCP